ncbi:MAG: hypothetical protein EBZ78_11970 [Verrucomicrobia bacterium]|nr:hypothetical protein [Verrucomicrobiota bacterium]
MLMAPSPERLPKVRDLMLLTLFETMVYLAPFTTTSELDTGTPLGVQFVTVDQDPLVFKVEVAAHDEPVKIRNIVRTGMKCFISEIKPTFTISQGLVAFGSIIS